MQHECHDLPAWYGRCPEEPQQGRGPRKRECEAEDGDEDAKDDEDAEDEHKDDNDDKNNDDTAAVDARATRRNR